MSKDYEKHYRRLAKENACEGVLYEPRIFYSEVSFSGGTEHAFPDPDIFYNGEQYPVRITHILAAMRDDVGGDTSPPETPTQGDPRLIQRFGMRVRAHDTYYMHSSYVPLPHWHNVRSAPVDVVAQGVSSWRFDKTFPIGHRDAMIVDVQILPNSQEQPTDSNTRRVGLSFHGTGRASGRPYHLATTRALTTSAVGSSIQLDPSDLRNDGAEIIDCHGMTVHCGSRVNDSNPAGDIRQLLVGVRQQGNGTNIDWQQGGASGNPPPLCPAALLGPSAGQAVVHRLPGHGWTWLPGQGLHPELRNFDTSRNTTEAVHLAMLGYVIVT